MIRRFYRTEHVHWAQGQRGEAPVHNYYEDDSILAKCKKVGPNYFLPNGDEVVITATWYVMVTQLDDSRPLSSPGGFRPISRSRRASGPNIRSGKSRSSTKRRFLAVGGLWKPNVMFWRVWLLKPATCHNRNNQDWESWTGSPARR